MELLAAAWEIAVHLDVHLAQFVAQHGAWVYALLFAIVFIETGLVIWPFLPGDHFADLHAHVQLALLGWVAPMILGVSARVYPMFLLAPAPRRWAAR